MALGELGEGMDVLRTLFSFKGEIGRGAFWGTMIGLGIVSIPVMVLCAVVGTYVGIPVFDVMNRPVWPHTFPGFAIFAFYWLFEFAGVWVSLAALVKRLRDVGIAPKWLAMFVPVFFLYGITLSVFSPVGTTHLSPVTVIAMIVTGVPTCGLGFWLIGSAFFAPGGKPQHFNPAQLPEGWKK